MPSLARVARTLLRSMFKSRSAAPSPAGDQRAGALQRALMGADSAQVERQLSVIHAASCCRCLSATDRPSTNSPTVRCSFASASFIFSMGSGVSLNRNFFFGAVGGAVASPAPGVSCGKNGVRSKRGDDSCASICFLPRSPATNLPTGFAQRWLADPSSSMRSFVDSSAPLAATASSGQVSRSVRQAAGLHFEMSVEALRSRRELHAAIDAQ